MVETSFTPLKSKKGCYGGKRQYFVGVNAARDCANKTRKLVWWYVGTNEAVIRKFMKSKTEMNQREGLFMIKVYYRIIELRIQKQKPGSGFRYFFPNCCILGRWYLIFILQY